MMPMIKLSDGCYVAADCIAEVKVNSSSQTITVRTKDGIGHSHTPAYKQGLYAALDDLVARIDAAMAAKEVCNE